MAKRSNVEKLEQDLALAKAIDGKWSASTAQWHEYHRGSEVVLAGSIGEIKAPILAIYGDNTQAFIQLTPSKARTLARLLEIAADKFDI